MNDFWRDTNAEGLVLAGEGRWPDATRAFADALAQLDAEDAEEGVTAVAHDDARAQLLLNLAQSHFHTGALAEARRFAERSCAIRVSLYGEESLVVARTRGDLAVIVGASGQPDEAMSLLERAVLAVEKKRGDASAHLVPLLTNAARLLERSSPELARPYVSRLKALLFARRLSDDAASITRTDVPLHSFGDDPFATASDDHYLRSAIAETVDLLRTTPAANTAVGDLAVAHPAVGEVADVDLGFGDLADVGQADVDHADVDQPNVDLAFGDHADVDLPIGKVSVGDHADVDFAIGQLAIGDRADDTMFDLVEPPPATLSALPAASRAPVSPLGFEVQYGIPEGLHAPLPEPPPTIVELAQPRITRPGIRAVGGVRRGSTQVMAPKRLWYIGVAVVAFGAGIGLTYIIMPLLR